jgi:hypothetical protein
VIQSATNRRSFLRILGAGAAGLTGPFTLARPPVSNWLQPPADYSLAPFWFWNDELSEPELARQILDFHEHGVDAFVIHPRVGLPRHIPWLGAEMIRFMRFAIEEAGRRGMWVILYDEGMYPSGSSSGQVVESDPSFRTRGLVHVNLDQAVPGSEVRGIPIGEDGLPRPLPGQNLVATVRRRLNGERLAIFDRAARAGFSGIRGLHYKEADPRRRDDGRDPPEDTPAGADILNPESVRCFIRLVYQRYYDEFGAHFGQTVRAIFTDEPSLLARRTEQGMVAGTTGILPHVSRWLGYDFTEHLPALWYQDEPDAERYRRDYHRALQARLEETFYRPISEWCEAHQILLTGHPAEPDDMGHLRYFHIPGQDIVWRYIEPDKPSSLEGRQSTQAKAAASAMLHLGRRRNANEYCGAYGHNLTFEEMQWLSHWLLVRGCNLLIPHAFYYSIRGPRMDERPPDVGPNSGWWDRYRPFAEACRRLCWLNSDSRQVCELAVLGLNDHLPWEAARTCFRNQRDFNYLEARHLWEDAKVSEDGIRLAGMHYGALVLEAPVPEQARRALEVLESAGRVIQWGGAPVDSSASRLLREIDRLIKPDLRLSRPAPDLRVRHVIKESTHYYLLFNEGRENLELKVETPARGPRSLLEPATGQRVPVGKREAITFAPHALRVLAIPV